MFQRDNILINLSKYRDILCVEVISITREQLVKFFKRMIEFSVSGQSNWYWAVVVFTFIAATTILIVPNVYPLYYIRSLFGIIFTVFLPGFVLIQTLFPRKNLSYYEILACSIGTSLAIISILGLMLSYTVGLRLNAVVATVASWTMFFDTTALYKSYKICKYRTHEV